ncbi:MAG: hypothetical protein M3Q16_09710 [Pseudomonadota bacterium]|nr:hypothetical protein [Pseudomonadota bacterium]
MSNESLNPWKLATIGILLVGATAAATMLVVGRDSETGLPDSQTAQINETRGSGAAEKAASSGKTVPAERQRTARAAVSHPSKSVMEVCNMYASEQVNSKTEEVLKSAALGAALGAAVGAAGGAIAGGGSGAGKGAAIGGITGAAGGSLYGLNENESHDEQYRAAYSSCMRSKGY